LVVDAGPTPDSRIAVWRSSVDDNVYYQVSADSAATWSTPSPIPGIVARPWNSSPFDQYAMVRDDKGIVHLALVTRRGPGTDTQWTLSYLQWRGKDWTKPEILFERAGAFPEYPRMAIALGNQVHVVWFTRSDIFKGGSMDVWHTFKEEGPLYTPVPGFVAATAVKPTALPAPQPTATATPLPRLPATADQVPVDVPPSIWPIAAGLGAAVFSILLGVVINTRPRRGPENRS
jgi:hypothetical protein